VLVAAVLGVGLVLVGMAERNRHLEVGTTAGAASLAGPGSASPAPPPAEVRAPWRPGAPRRLLLPSLGVTAPVVPVHAPGRTLIPPRDPATLGWWADGVRPGGRHGSALIAGHTVHGTGTGALERIGELAPGDPVVVGTGAGRLRYVVTRVLRFDKGVVAERAPRLFRQDGPPRLVLVTCADWDGTRFRSNVVVEGRPASLT
jgi:hypothetical protein